MDGIVDSTQALSAAEDIGKLCPKLGEVS